MKFIGIATLLLLFFSCTEEVEIDIPKKPSKLVINSLFTPFILPYPKQFIVYIEKSTDLLDTITKTKVAGATVIIFESDSILETLTFDENFGYYYSSNFHPLEEKIYKIKAYFDNDTACGEDKIPRKVSLTGISVLPYVGKNEEGDIYSEVTITFNDPENEENFYEFQITDDSYGYLGKRIFSDEPAIKSETYYPTLLAIGKQYPQYLPFKDKLLKRGTNKLRINYYAPMSTNKDSILTHLIFIHFNTISENYYNYRTSLLKQSYNIESDILYGQSEIINVHSNIIDGYGIFAGYTNDIKTLIIYDGKPIEEFY